MDRIEYKNKTLPFDSYSQKIIIRCLMFDIHEYVRFHISHLKCRMVEKGNIPSFDSSALPDPIRYPFTDSHYLPILLVNKPELVTYPSNPPRYRPGMIYIYLFI